MDETTLPSKKMTLPVKMTWPSNSLTFNVGLALVRRGPPPPPPPPPLPPQTILGFSGILNSVGWGWDGAGGRAARGRGLRGSLEA